MGVDASYDLPFHDLLDLHEPFWPEQGLLTGYEYNFKRFVFGQISDIFKKPNVNKSASFFSVESTQLYKWVEYCLFLKWYETNDLL